VERAQKTVLDEFYATTSLTSATPDDDGDDWLDGYHYSRVHGGLGLGVTPSSAGPNARTKSQPGRR